MNTKSIGEHISRVLSSTTTRKRCIGSCRRMGLSNFHIHKNRLFKRNVKLPFLSQRVMSGSTLKHGENSQSWTGMPYHKFVPLASNKTCIISSMRLPHLQSINSNTNSSILPPLFTQPIRTKCGRENCDDPCKWPLCPPSEKQKPTKNPMINIYEAYWDEREKDICDCAEDECSWAFTRFDDLYHQESDKKNRVYTRTWWECPPRIIQRRICCYEDGLPPEFCKRAKSERPTTACKPEVDQTCIKASDKCPRITMACCCPATKVVNCKIPPKAPADCRKFCAPYPSFSECQKPRPKPVRKKECLCYKVPSTCEIYEYLRTMPPEKPKCK